MLMDELHITDRCSLKDDGKSYLKEKLIELREKLITAAVGFFFHHHSLSLHSVKLQF